MKLRECLREWPGINDLKSDLDRVRNMCVGIQETRKEIADALLVVLSGEAPPKVNMWGSLLEDHGARFEEALSKVASNKALDAARDMVEGRVGSEAFIDEIIARVRRKQLDS